jgi:hypothetical protein
MKLSDLLAMCESDPKCVRCGWCCQKIACPLGTYHGSPPAPCSFLRGSGPGFYSCGLIDDGLIPPEAIAADTGCSSSLFNQQREQAKLARGEKS